MLTRFTELLSGDDVVLPLVAKDKWDAIEVLLRHIEASGHVPAGQLKAYREAVLARERSMSTGMERGIAIPHAAVDGLDRLVGAFGVVKSSTGLAFDAIDAQPTTMVVLLLVPRSQKLQHISTLADIARLLSREEVRDAIVECEEPAGVWRVLASAENGD
jgi:mannitol/fructose-specific phosphotransferase system IIA component (Ntr-type)